MTTLRPITSFCRSHIDENILVYISLKKSGSCIALPIEACMIFPLEWRTFNHQTMKIQKLLITQICQSSIAAASFMSIEYSFLLTPALQPWNRTAILIHPRSSERRVLFNRHTGSPDLAMKFLAQCALVWLIDLLLKSIRVNCFLTNTF